VFSVLGFHLQKFVLSLFRVVSANFLAEDVDVVEALLLFAPVRSLAKLAKVPDDDFDNSFGRHVEKKLKLIFFIFPVQSPVR
jgi:hypothetical protein